MVGGWNGAEVEVVEVGRTGEIVEAVDKKVEEEGGRTEVGEVVAVKFNNWLSKSRADPVVVILSNKLISK